MPIDPPTGVSIYKKSKARKGYTLYAPLRQDRAYLIDMEGKVVHRWRLGPGGVNHAQLLPNGNLFNCEWEDGGPPLFAGKGGRLREYAWNGKVVWEHIDDTQHHDARRLPNGNTMYLAWKKMSRKDAKRVRGGMPKTEAPGGAIYCDVAREIDPDGNVVWEWSSDMLKIENYAIGPLFKRDEFAHANTLFPMKNGDIMVNFRTLHTVMIIDRKTKKVKWEHRDETWGGPHDPHILPNRNILLFANGYKTPEEWPFSRVIEFNPRTRKTVWQYTGRNALHFFSPHISGAQRLDNGNTLICEGGHGRLFEVTRDKEIVWQYVNPHEREHAVLGVMNSIFRAYRYAPDYAGLKGRL